MQVPPLYVLEDQIQQQNTTINHETLAIDVDPVEDSVAVLDQPSGAGIVMMLSRGGQTIRDDRPRPKAATLARESEAWE